MGPILRPNLSTDASRSWRSKEEEEEEDDKTLFSKSIHATTDRPLIEAANLND
jgi:hypothetical protein